jgi:hypothetical protein
MKVSAVVRSMRCMRTPEPAGVFLRGNVTETSDGKVTSMIATGCRDDDADLLPERSRPSLAMLVLGQASRVAVPQRCDRASSLPATSLDSQSEKFEMAANGSNSSSHSVNSETMDASNSFRRARVCKESRTFSRRSGRRSCRREKCSHLCIRRDRQKARESALPYSCGLP